MFRAIDLQSTMGAWVGKLDAQNGLGLMAERRYTDGADYPPDDAQMKNQGRGIERSLPAEAAGLEPLLMLGYCPSACQTEIMLPYSRIASCRDTDRIYCMIDQPVI